MISYLDTSAIVKLLVIEPGTEDLLVLFQVIEVTQPLVERAGEFAEAFALRGFDAVQLASADAVRASIQSDLLFVSFDRILNRAAKLLGMHLPSFAPL